VASRNAIQHGLFARDTCLHDEDPEELQAFSARIHADLQPQSPTEMLCVELIVDTCWRLKRCVKADTKILEWYRTHDGVRGDAARALANDLSQLACLPQLSRYATTFVRRLTKALAELKKLKARPSSQPAITDPDEAPPPRPEAETFGGPDGCPQPTLQGQPTSVPEGHLEDSPHSRPSPSRLDECAVLFDEDRGQFQHYRERLFADWTPRGPAHASLVEPFALAGWTLGRLSRIEAGLFEHYRFKGGVDGGLVTAFAQDRFELDCFSILSQIENQLQNRLWRLLEVLLAVSDN